jgi:FKBP-type peptidyl-prolyl cis-trans isomerase
MITKEKLFIAILGMCIALTACTKGFKKTKNGIQYKIHTHGKEDRKINPGDIITFHYTMKNDKDSIVDESIKMGVKPLIIAVDSPTTKEIFHEALLYVSKGDSATFIFPADSLFKNMNGMYPPGVAKGSNLSLIVKIYNVQTKAEKMAEMREEEIKMKKEQEKTIKEMEKQKPIDDQLIKDYLKKENLKAEKTASGLYYIIEKKGTGDKATAGDVVKVNYTGKLLDGTKFDSNVDPLFNHVTPLEFQVGIGQVISGWDEGLQLLTKGTKAKFIIPSGLAYGNRSAGNIIKPFSILVFDVELLEIIKNKK